MKVKGFTLVEVLVVSVIVGILSATAVPAMMGYVKRAADQVCEHTAAAVLTSVVTYIQDSDPGLVRLTPGEHRDLDQLNAILGSYSIKLPDQFEIDVFVIDAKNITVFITDEENMGEASIGS
ncbi:MAG: prepilin-type N-terminal cleavage/methylation domain-containing protein [Candidatus Delongbacteria bacterium]|nr:prepilin-type N-terminal cleavage/methylation domain-containing protein [Candidatus Delongbacteria bacterium]